MQVRRCCCAIFVSALLTAAAAHAAPAPAPAHPPAPAAQPLPIVVLIELDGFRWDCIQRDEPKNLLALARHGAWAPQGMLPSYPAEDASNQFTIVTGLYPGRHGIVADTFIDPARQARFAASDPKAAADGSWYTGTPLWSLAESHGVRAACIGWLGCEATIAGYKPKYIAGEAARPERQILAWLRMPEADRPRLIAARFAEPGETARRFGPDAPETQAAVRRLDAELGRLKSELDATHLPIDLVVVSDRGLAKPDGPWITLDQYASLAGFENAGTLLYGKTEADRERVYNLLKKATSEYFVYRLKNLPADLHDRNERIGDPVIFATGAYPIRIHAPAGPADVPPRSVDGFDPHIVPQMKAIFIAAGPDIVEGRTVAPFENVNLYPWLAHLLGLTPPKSDGSLNILSGILRDNGDSR